MGLFHPLSVGSVSKAFREANLHVTTESTVNLSGNITESVRNEFVHEILSPALYQFGSGSYYSESEYSMDEGQWQKRLWDHETYQKLLEVKNRWDPEHIFGCRHCVGYGEEPEEVSDKT